MKFLNKTELYQNHLKAGWFFFAKFKMGDDMPKFKIENLNVSYGDLHALKNINMNIPKNKIVSLIGSSGCGKSTFLKALNRLNENIEGCRWAGKILLDGEDILGDIDIKSLRKRVGMVFQRPNPFPMSIYDNVAFGPRANGIRKRQDLDLIVEQSLKKAALWDEIKDQLKKSAMKLSGGQQQRLCIARSLAVKPEVLLLDEPTSALDPISTEIIERLLLELKSEYTIIIVTHNMKQASRISDYTAYFLLGELVEYDETSKIFMCPTDERTRKYLNWGS